MFLYYLLYFILKTKSSKRFLMKNATCSVTIDVRLKEKKDIEKAIEKR